MKNLLQINCTANWGSTGKIAEQIGRKAAERGWDSYLAYGRYVNPSQLKLIRVGSAINPYLHYAEQRIRDNEGQCSRLATRRLIKQIEDIKPDVIQLHNIHDHFLNYPLLFSYLNQTDIKVVWTFHDCWAFTGHCYHFVTQNCDRWKTGCHDCPLKDNLLDGSQQNWELKKSLFSVNRNLTIVACSQWMADFVRESFLGNKPTSVIHNGIDLNVFRPEVIGVPQNKGFHILAVSNVWSRDKGIDDIYLLRKMLSPEFVITVVGLSKAQVQSLPEGIIGIQRTQNVRELVWLYNSADVLINPTYADTFPTVNLESLACGIPVVTYRTGGSPEAIDEATGVVVQQGDINALADAIKRLKDTPLSREACRKRAELLFDKDRCFSQYIDLYESIL